MENATLVRFTHPRFVRELNRLKQLGLLSFLDNAVYVVIRSVRRMFYRWNRGIFGLKEALYWGRYVDKWHRYSAVLTKIDQITGNEKSAISILEVGCGSEGLAEFNPYLNNDSYTVDSLDVVLPDNALHRKYPEPFRKPMLGDACDMPFDDDSRDFVISIDSLEHVPQGNRSSYLRELIRVAKRGVLLTCPMRSTGGDYVGDEYDARYQEWYTERFGNPNLTISEHLEFGEPSIDELNEFMVHPETVGVLNAETWLKCMTLSGIPLLGHLTGFWFLISGARKAGDPPYYGGMLYLKK